ncbi:MAG: hypothetical protein ACJAXK_000598 [Yoonia sp.]|jgi:hypothetical protein
MRSLTPSKFDDDYAHRFVDDATAGGVMRAIEHILTAPDFGVYGQHSLMHIPRSKISAPIAMDCAILVRGDLISDICMPMPETS